MSLDAGVFGQLMGANLVTSGANGENAVKFCVAVATGIVNTLKGAAFDTLDVGSVPGVGEGTGTGLVGMDSDNMQQVALAAMPSQGTNAPLLMKSIMESTVEYLGEATSLSSTDFPVYVGSGTIVLGSIEVTEDAMAQNIFDALPGNGTNKMAISKAISAGVVSGLLTATGELVIIGTPTGIPSPGTSPGKGKIS